MSQTCTTYRFCKETTSKGDSGMSALKSNEKGATKMDTIKTSEEINHNRRRFCGTAAMTIAAAQFVTLGSAFAQPVIAKVAGALTTKPGTHTSLGPLKQIDAGLLNIGYAEAGPANGPAVILLHGWPYDIHSFVDVAPLLAAAGYRVIVPYLRGYGTTQLSLQRNDAQRPAVGRWPRHYRSDGCAQDPKAIVAGFDWGARTADVMAVLWPERCKAIVSVSGYLISSPAGNQVPCRPSLHSVLVPILFRH